MKRIEMPLIDKKDRNSFLEVAQGLTLEQAVCEAKRCLDCKNAPCKRACPVNVDIPKFLGHLKQGDKDKAYEVILETNSLPSICGRVCPQEHQCEGVCVRNRIDEPVAIGYLERFCGDNGSATEPQPTHTYTKNKSVAIAGSGPCGLSCAAELCKKGFKVTVFEALHSFGGVLTYGIPEFRLPKSVVAREINSLKSMGVQFVSNVVVGKTLTMQQLLQDYFAVFIASGAGLPSFFGIEGENLNGILSANEYLTRVNLMQGYKQNSQTPVQIAQDVLVFGAGNVAMDAARTALRMGAKNVSLVYRRTIKEIPARQEEVLHATQEGVKILELLAPQKFLGSEKVSGVSCVKMTLGEPDASGRRQPIMTQEVVEIACDMAIIAIGTAPNPIISMSTLELETGAKGQLLVDENMKTSLDRVYAGGDAVTGAATVILAMGAGKKAANSIAKLWEERA